MIEPTKDDHRLADDMHALTSRVCTGDVERFANDDELRREAQDLLTALETVLTRGR